MCIGCGVAFFCIYLHLFAFICIAFFAISICIPPPPDIVFDKMAAISQILWGRACPMFAEQQRILRRLAHRLWWSGVGITLSYTPSEMNPADPISR